MNMYFFYFERKSAFKHCQSASCYYNDTWYLLAVEFRIRALRSLPRMESCSKYLTGAELQIENKII